MKKIKILNEAEREFAEIVLQYASENINIALRFFQEVTDAFTQLAQHPKMGAPFHKDFRKFVLRNFPYNIFYKETEDSITVESIAHQRRQPGYWLGRN